MTPAYGKSKAESYAIYILTHRLCREILPARISASQQSGKRRLPPLAAIRAYISAGSVSQGLEEGQQLLLLRFAQVAESPHHMFGLAFMPLDGILQRE